MAAAQQPRLVAVIEADEMGRRLAGSGVHLHLDQPPADGAGGQRVGRGEGGAALQAMPGEGFQKDRGAAGGRQPVQEADHLAHAGEAVQPQRGGGPLVMDHQLDHGARSACSGRSVHAAGRGGPAGALPRHTRERTRIWARQSPEQ